MNRLSPSLFPFVCVRVSITPFYFLLHRRPGGRWPIDLVLVYLTEAVNLKERRDVAVAQLGKPGQVKSHQIVSFAGMLHGGVAASWGRKRLREGRVTRWKDTGGCAVP